jgi:nitroreductase
VQNHLDTIKAGPSETGVHKLLLKRWSPRAFNEQPVSREDLQKIFTAASWAASSYNEQPWRFLVGRKGEATYQLIFDALIDFNKSWAGTAPVLILSVAKATMTKDGSENSHAQHDTGAASANMCLQAAALDLYMHGMAGFDKAKANDSFRLPSDYAPITVWALGRLGDVRSLPDFLQQMETAPRSRKDLSDFVFTSWEQAAEL